MTPEQIIARAHAIVDEEELESWGSWHGEHGVGVSWDGSRAEGWLVLARMLERQMPVEAIRRVWHIRDGEVTGPRWEIVFHTEVNDAKS